MEGTCCLFYSRLQLKAHSTPYEEDPLDYSHNVVPRDPSPESTFSYQPITKELPKPLNIQRPLKPAYSSDTMSRSRDGCISDSLVVLTCFLRELLFTLARLTLIPTSVNLTLRISEWQATDSSCRIVTRKQLQHLWSKHAASKDRNHLQLPSTLWRLLKLPSQKHIFQSKSDNSRAKAEMPALNILL
jgi:hypothetical protein